MGLQLALVAHAAGAIGRVHEVFFPKKYDWSMVLGFKKGDSAMGAVHSRFGNNFGSALFPCNVKTAVADGVVDFNFAIFC